LEAHRRTRIAHDDLADLMCFRSETCEHASRIVYAYERDHADAAIESAQHLRVIEIGFALQPGEHGRQGEAAEIDLSSWERPAVFTWLASLGVEEDEMRRVFNLGLGYAAIVKPDDTDLAIRALERAGEHAWVAGRVVEGSGVLLR